MWKASIASGLAVLIAFSVWWVQAPPRGEVAYREAAETSVKKLRSRVETARLWVEQLERDRVHPAAAKIALEEAESGANAALSQFESYRPPRGLEPLRSVVGALGDDVQTALGDLRIVAHQDRWASAERLADGLPALSTRLDELSRRAEP